MNVNIGEQLPTVEQLFNVLPDDTCQVRILRQFDMEDDFVVVLHSSDYDTILDSPKMRVLFSNRIGVVRAYCLRMSEDEIGRTIATILVSNRDVTDDIKELFKHCDD